jgi:hypothetical protein
MTAKLTHELLLTASSVDTFGVRAVFPSRDTLTLFIVTLRNAHGSLTSRDGTATYAHVSSGTVCETTSEPEPQKEPEPRNNHPESVETSILYRCTVLGAQQLNSNRRESCNFSMPDQLLSIEPSTEIPRTEVYKISIFLLCNLIINNHQTIFSNFQPSFASFSPRKYTLSSSSAYLFKRIHLSP